MSNWRRSTFCDSGNCVEVGCRCDTGSCVELSDRGDTILLRDSKDPGGAVLGFTRDEWMAFIRGAKQGEFDV